ncbi:MAG TPA: hypothetical protein VLX85_09785 [Stellaceae bacterium]|nr:hypothetical protein [Stellaceae bacterium]
MLTIQWIALRRDGTRGVVERTTFPKDSLSQAMAEARARFDEVKARHPNGAPDGFVVLDAAGGEIGRFFLPGTFDKRETKK